MDVKEKCYSFNIILEFDGCVDIQAESKEEALHMLENDFGVTIGSTQSTNDKITNWAISIHPDNIKVTED